MEAISYVDGLIQEYFLFRGYIKTYTTFTEEKSNDKTSQPNVQIIADQLLSLIDALDLAGFVELWKTIESRSAIISFLLSIYHLCLEHKIHIHTYFSIYIQLCDPITLLSY